MRALALCLASLGLGGTAWAQAAPTGDPASAPPGDGPRIQLAPPDEPPPPPKTTDITVGRDQAPSLDLGSGRRIPVGSYGETHLVLQDGQNQIKLRRLVLDPAAEEAHQRARAVVARRHHLQAHEVQRGRLLFEAGQLGHQLQQLIGLQQPLRPVRRAPRTPQAGDPADRRYLEPERGPSGARPA